MWLLLVAGLSALKPQDQSALSASVVGAAIAHTNREFTAAEAALNSLVPGSVASSQPAAPAVSVPSYVQPAAPSTLEGGSFFPSNGSSRSAQGPLAIAPASQTPPQVALAEQAAIERATAERAATEREALEKAEKAASDKVEAERAAAERALADRAAAEKAVAEKAAADRAAESAAAANVATIATTASNAVPVSPYPGGSIPAAAALDASAQERAQLLGQSRNYTSMQSVASSQASSSTGSTSTADKTYTVDELLMPGYTASEVKSQKPPSSGALAVDSKIIITNFQNLDQVAGTYMLQGTVMTVWRDARLAMPLGVDRVALTVGDTWTPAHDYYNALTITKPASKLALLSWSEPQQKAYKMSAYDGPTLVQTERFAATFAVRMAFYNFPFDKHTLPVQLEIFGNPSDAVQFKTTEVVLMDGLNDAVWKIDSATSSVSLVTKQTGLTYARQTVHINVSRMWGNQAISIFAPLILIYILSYLSYFMDPAGVPARTALTIISLLCSITYYDLVDKQLPSRGYFTFLDVYSVCCILSSGIGVLIFVRVHWLQRLEKAAKSDDKALEPTPGMLDRFFEKVPGYTDAPASARLDLAMQRIWPLYFMFTCIIPIIPLILSFVADYDSSDFA